MKRYLWFLIPALGIVAVLVAMMLTLNDNLVFYYEPTDVVAGEVTDAGERFRLGGQVATRSVATTGTGVSFDVTDGRETIRVVHNGDPQSLFQEGIGVVIEGTWDGERFHSDTMMVRHDEQYRTEDGIYETPESGITGP